VYSQNLADEIDITSKQDYDHVPTRLCLHSQSIEVGGILPTVDWTDDGALRVDSLYCPFGHNNDDDTVEIRFFGNID